MHKIILFLANYCYDQTSKLNFWVCDVIYHFFKNVTLKVTTWKFETLRQIIIYDLQFLPNFLGFQDC